MKKFIFMAAALVMGSAMFTSCSKEDEVKENLVQVTFEGDYFTKLIDTPQFKGALLYSANEYKWTDAATSLSSSCRKDDWSVWGEKYAGQFGWGNGIAISNYVDADETASSNKQLSVPASNGSSNFAIVWDDDSQLAFADNTAHVIKTMQVSPTTYCLNNVKKAAGEGYEFKVIATGTKADGTTSTLDIVLAKGSDVKTSWFTVDMSTLGAVKSVSFKFDGTDKSQYGGLSTPKYFALDNVVVVK